MINAQATPYEQQLLSVVRSLSGQQQRRLLDYALFVQSQPSPTPNENGHEHEERIWAQTAIGSLAKYWDTPEEDEAWAYLQKETS